MLSPARIDRLEKICEYIIKKNIKGISAEVGVYKGGSSIAIHNVLNRRHYAFDTFDGLRDVGDKDGTKMENGMFATELSGVRKLFKDTNIKIVRGYFPDSLKKIHTQAYSLVHIDCDTYESIKSCLEFFYPLVSGKGFLVMDDYNCTSTPGAKLAVDEFVDKHGCKFMEGPHPQGIIQK